MLLPLADSLDKLGQALLIEGGKLVAIAADDKGRIVPKGLQTALNVVFAHLEPEAVAILVADSQVIGAGRGEPSADGMGILINPENIQRLIKIRRWAILHQNPGPGNAQAIQAAVCLAVGLLHLLQHQLGVRRALDIGAHPGLVSAK